MIITDATNLPRLMNCNGSRLMLADPVFTERDDTIRNEGYAAHWLASVVFNKKHTLEQLIDRKAPNGVYITADMAEHVNDYLTAIGPGGEMEWSYQLNGPEWQINGRADHIKYVGELDGSTTLHIPDFKYGYGIVEPFDNWTLISHALGFCETNNLVPSKIVMTIHQPRAAHHAGKVREREIGPVELMQYKWLINSTLSNPSDILQTGEHCYKCPSFASCPARQSAEMNAIETAHMAFNAHISNEDLAERMDQIARAISLLEQSKKVYEEQTMARVKAGQVVANYGLQNDLTNRMWLESVTPDMLDAMAGHSICERKLPRLNIAETALGKDMVNMLTERRSKGTKLVRMDANKKGEKLFGKK